MNEIGFDIVGDIDLRHDQVFSWKNKVTSPYCIITGNISSDLSTVIDIIVHLSKQYQGVFFVPGPLEYHTMSDIDTRTRELLVISECVPNVCMLHQNVVIIDGLALLGANGWHYDPEKSTIIDSIENQVARSDDRYYLEKTLSKLQRHLDVKKIVMITNEVPKRDLYYGELPDYVPDIDQLETVLEADTERKVSHWIFGTYLKSVDTQCDGINYLNGPYENSSVYWPKRLTITI